MKYTWSETCDKLKQHLSTEDAEKSLSCQVAARGIVWNVVQIASLVAVIAGFVFLSQVNKIKMGSTVSRRKKSLPVTLCLVVATILQLVAILVWEIASPIRKQMYDDLDSDKRDASSTSRFESAYCIAVIAVNIVCVIGFAGSAACLR